ncbi:MobF family relaxase [Actinosynnema sp. NPDC023587]|uniref:MobF family relaxase n=1 Tax=Actinosynnema sp. NPDC023587 TaxID=3154695 RepID=UPI0033D49DDB
MAYVTPLYSGTDAQIDYRLGMVQAGCVSDTQFAYHADARERPLRWVGQGLTAFGLVDQGVVAGAELTPDQYDMARALVRGFHPGTGEQLVVGKVAVPPAAKVPSSALVAAVTAEAQRLNVAPEELFEGKKARAAYATAAREVARRPARAALKVTDAERLARVAGLDPEQVWAPEKLADARTALYEQRPVLDDDGNPKFTRAGRPVTERVERRDSVRIYAFDVGIGVPKWASVFLAFSPDGLVDRVEDAYATATDTTFRWLEGRTGYVRIGTEGRGQQARFAPSSGMAGWVMTHRAARPVGDAEVGDPHWHVHITVANLAQGPDGKWRGIAAGGRDLMRHTHAIDAVTQAQIRHELHAEYGVEFTRSERTGQWALSHVPDAAISQFSKRHDQVMAALKRLGYDGNTGVSAAQARVLTRTSRSAKSESTAASDATLRQLWRAEAVAADLDPDEWMPRVLAAYNAGHARVDADVNASAKARFGIDVDELVDALTHPETGLTAYQRRFDHLEALVAVAEALPNGAAIGDVEQLTAVVLAHPAFLAIDGPNALQGQKLAGAERMRSGQAFTTADVPALERDIITAVTASRPEQDKAVVAADTVAMATSVAEAGQGFELSDEQRQVLHQVVTNGRQFEGIEGPPGTGKTTLMRAARLAWEAQGYVVAGGATAAVAAQNLAAESGIESRTVAQWRWRIGHRNGLDGVDVLVLDEANLTSDRDRAALYAEALRTGTKVVEVGDPRQLRGVGVGSMFGYLHATLDGPRLTENRRQHVEDERRALAAFRNGDHLDALRTWERIGGVVATETADEAVAAMASRWMTARAGAPDPHTEARGVLMLAATNEQVARLNTTAQAVRLAEGELAGPGTTYDVGDDRRATFHIGDQVLIRRNDRTGEQVDGDGVLNGYRGVVTALHDGTGNRPEGVEVAWFPPGASLSGEPSSAVLTPAYIADGGLDLGYALTAHKAEGLTVSASWDRPDGTRNSGTVLTYGPGQDAPGLYVSLSRDRGQALLFAARQDIEGLREDALYGPPRDQTELTERVLAALAERATATAENANDRPVLVDLGEAPPLDRLTNEPPAASTPEPVPATEPEPDERQPLDLSPTAVFERMTRWRHEQDADQGEPIPAEQDHEPAPALDDEQRRSWRELNLRIAVASDSDTRDAVLAERAAFLEQLGTERAEALRQETQAAREQIRERVAAREQKFGEAWRARPLGRLTDGQLVDALAEAAADRAEHLAAAEHAQARLADLEPAVTTGHGPLVVALDERLAELRRQLDLHTRADEAAQQRIAARAEADDLARQARRKETDAERVPWYRPGRRDQILRDASDLHTQAREAQARSADHARTLRELLPQLGDDRPHPSLARAALQRAEASYPADRDRAEQNDRTDVDELHRRITTSRTAVADLDIRRADLVAEQGLREAMSPAQRTSEADLRRQAAAAELQERLAEQRAARERAARFRRTTAARRDDYYDAGPDQSLHRGMGLGR